MVLKKISHRFISRIFIRKKKNEYLYWRQCQRIYTFQPIYRVNGNLMAIELLTAVFHPDTPEQRISPESYFAALAVPQRLQIVQEQLEFLLRWEDKFLAGQLVVSINLDGPTLLAIEHSSTVRQLIARCSWLRFELVEHHLLPEKERIAKIPELGALWLDDFGSGMANFSALSGLKFGHIKLARELFILLRASEEGRQLFNTLLKLINHYCDGVIVEGVETREEWDAVKDSPAFAAQGYYFSRPLPFEQFDSLPFYLT